MFARAAESGSTSTDLTGFVGWVADVIASLGAAKGVWSRRDRVAHPWRSA